MKLDFLKIRSLRHSFKIKNLKLKIFPGLTLVELLITVAILGMLVAILFAIINPLEQNRKANDSLARNTAAEFLQASQRYNTDNGTYPWETAACINFPTPTPTPPPVPTPTGVLGNIAAGVLHYWNMNGATGANETDQVSTGGIALLDSGSNISIVGPGVGTAATARSANNATNNTNYMQSNGQVVPSTGAYSIAFWARTTNTGSGLNVLSTNFIQNQGAIYCAGWSAYAAYTGINFTLSGNTGESFQITNNGANYNRQTCGTGANCGFTPIWCPNPYNVVVTGTVSVQDGLWHYFVITWTGDTATNGIKLYIDCNSSSCIPAAQGTAPFTNPGQSYPLFLWYDHTGYGTTEFPGDIDELGIWPLILTPSQIANMYNFYKGVAPPPTPTPTPAGIGTSLIVTPAPISNFATCINNYFIPQGELKTSFNSLPSSVLQNVVLIQPNPILTPADPESLSVCYLPKSRFAQQDAQAKYVQSGNLAPYTDPVSNTTTYGYNINGVVQTTNGSCIAAGGSYYCYVCLN